MELISDASYLFGRMGLSDHRTSRPMFRVLLRNRTAEVGKMVADGARRIAEALEHRADRRRRALGEGGVEDARHVRTVALASALGCPSGRRRGERHRGGSHYAPSPPRGWGAPEGVPQ